MSCVRRCLPALAALAFAATPATGQRAQPDVWREYTTGDELESYLRTLQALGDVPLEPWSLRPFSPIQLDRLRAPGDSGPWRARIGAGAERRRVEFGIIRPRIATQYNSTFPHGGNDGAVWAGRGLNAAVSGGFALRFGALSLTVHPVAFWAQNQEFPLLENGRSGTERYNDGLFPLAIDRPQRFGPDAYARLDPGQSTLRLDALGATVGVSSANEWWGPAQEYPFLLGTNAAGFPHLFAGTSRPVDLWIARAHARLIYGRLEQSEHFVPTGRVQRARRFATGILVLLTPRGMDYLELGGARFFHAPWPDRGLPGRYLARPFEGLYKSSLSEVDDPIDTDSRSIDGENQLASVFARLVLPGTGFEVYGEIGREDHPWDVRHLILSPDEQSSMTIGVRKSWRRGAGLGVVRAEAINFQQRQVDRFRLGASTYIHWSGSNQGHTNRGQLLGADVGVGSSAGAIVGIDLLDPDGRTSVEWRRVVRQEIGVLGAGGAENTRALDVIHTLGVERLVFRGGMDLAAGLDASHNFNRDFARDRTNIAVRLAATLPGW